MTKLDLGGCENDLRSFYNISDNVTLYIKKMDIIQEGIKIPKIEYSIYCKLNGSNLIRLNLSVCEKSKISLSIPIVLSEDIDKLNKSSNYYNNICYTTKSDSGTDIILKDRKKEFIEGNKTICQEDCDFTNYNYAILKAECTCKVKESSSSFLDIYINTTELSHF